MLEVRYEALHPLEFLLCRFSGCRPNVIASLFDVVCNMHQLIFAIVLTHSTTAKLDSIGDISFWINYLHFHDLWMLIPQNHLNLVRRCKFANSFCNCSAPKPTQLLFFILFVSLCRPFVAGNRDFSEQGKRPIGARFAVGVVDMKMFLNIAPRSEEHTSELPSLR